MRLIAEQLHQDSPALRYHALTLALEHAPKVRLGLRDGGSSGRAQAERVLYGVRTQLTEADPVMRRKASEICGICKDLTAAPQLIQLLGDENAQVRAQALAALQSISGRDYGSSPKKWRTWLHR